MILITEPLQRISLDEFLSNHRSNNKNPIRIILLDEVTDPQNVGAIIRSSVIFGCEGIIITKNNSPQESGLLAKSAAGALEIANIFRIPNLARTLTELKKNNFWVIGLDSDTKKNLNTMIY